jgi:hypothetical protein
MSAIPYEGDQQDWDGYDDADALAPPARRRRRFWGRGTAVLLGVILVAAAFYAGVRVEKAQISSSPTTLPSAAAGAGAAGARGGAGGLGSRFAGAGAGTGAGAGAGAGGAAGAAGAAAAAGGGAGGGGGGFAGALRGGGLGGGNSSFGTASTIDGNTIYLTQPTTGNTIKVKLSSATKITKSVGVAKSALRPGDTLVIQGLKQSNGSISATSVSDSGARSAAGGSGGGGGGSGGGGSGGGGAAVNSLFGAGGSG